MKIELIKFLSFIYRLSKQQLTNVIKISALQQY